MHKRRGGERYKDVTQTPYFSRDYALVSFLRYAAHPRGGPEPCVGRFLDRGEHYMTATRTAVPSGGGSNSARAGRLAALGLGIALFASACGGGSANPTNGSTAGAGAASGLSCPSTGSGAQSTEHPTGDPAQVPASKGSTATPLKLGTLLPNPGTLAYLGPPEIAAAN